MSLKHGGHRDGSAIFVALILLAAIWYLVVLWHSRPRDSFFGPPSPMFRLK